MGKYSLRLCICISVLGLLMVLPMNQICEAKDKVIELKFGADVPPMAPAVKVWSAWADDVNKLTKGRVKINMFWGQALVRAGEQRRALLKGIADIAQYVLFHDLDNHQLSTVMRLPMMGFTGPEMATRIWYDIYEKFPEVRAEFKGTHRLWYNMSLPGIFHTKKKPVRTPDDLKGVKLQGDVLILKALGATPVKLLPPDIYMAMDRGIIDGSYGSWVGPGIFKYMKLVPYHTELASTINLEGFIFSFSKASWEKLPPDIQKTIDGLNEEYQKKIAEVFMNDHARFKQQAVDMKQTIIKLTPEETERFVEKVRPSHEEWIAEREKKGLPARAVYDEVKRLVKAYSK